MKIIASMTTIPSRIDLIKPVLDSIKQQTILVEKIEINVPYICVRTGEKYNIPEWLLAMKDVEIHRTEDYGAITKIAPTLLRHKDEDVLIWSVDDDFKYPINMLAILYRMYDPAIPRILSHSGGMLKLKGNVLNINTHTQEGKVDFIEGFATVLYPTNVIKEDFEEYVIQTATQLDNRKSDDIIISNYFVLKGVSLYNCADPSNSLKIYLCQLSHWKDKDALHRQDTGHNIRYVRVLHWLNNNNYLGWLLNLSVALHPSADSSVSRVKPTKSRSMMLIRAGKNYR